MMNKHWVGAYEKLSRATAHFEHVAELFGSSCFRSPTPSGASKRDSFVSSLLKGQAELEAALSQVMAVYEDEDGSGAVGSQFGIVQRASFATAHRVAILECDTADFADLIRRFRDNLTQGADAMVPPSAAHLAIAAAAVAQKVLSDYFRFLKMPCPQSSAGF